MNGPAVDAVVPLPKFHAQLVMGAMEVEVLTRLTERGAVPICGVAVKFATGPAGAEMMIVLVAVDETIPFETVKRA